MHLQGLRYNGDWTNIESTNADIRHFSEPVTKHRTLATEDTGAVRHIMQKMEHLHLYKILDTLASLGYVGRQIVNQP